MREMREKREEREHREEREERERRERRDSQIDTIFLKQINRPIMEKRISKASYIVGRKGKLKL